MIRRLDRWMVRRMLIYLYRRGMIGPPAPDLDEQPGRAETERESRRSQDWRSYGARIRPK